MDLASTLNQFLPNNMTYIQELRLELRLLRKTSRYATMYKKTLPELTRKQRYQKAHDLAYAEEILSILR